LRAAAHDDELGAGTGLEFSDLYPKTVVLHGFVDLAGQQQLFISVVQTV